MKGTTETKIVNPTIKYGIAFIFALIGISASVRLIAFDSGVPGATVAAGLSVFGLLVIFFADRVDWFDVKSFKVQLRKVEKARQEVEDVALILAEITSFIAAFHRRIGSQEKYDLEKKWMQAKIEELLNGMDAESKTRESVLSYLTKAEELDIIKRDGTGNTEEFWDEIWKDIETNIKC